jgi:Zn-dependent peptidase ImmA (M78 family)/transcriptional regulator with XRE-family HTH domain
VVQMVGDAAQPRMLVLARESRAMTQGQLAEALKNLDGPGSKISQGYVSRAEAGRLTVTGERLELYALALDYPISLLCLKEQEFGAGAGLVHHRKKQAVSAIDLRRIHALLNLTRIQLRALMPGAPRASGDRIPQIAVDDFTTPADAARRLRAEWAAPGGPLDSMVAFVEQTGALVTCRELVAPVPLDSGAESVPVDAVSCSPVGEDPLVLLNVGTPTDRQRFTLAHELGHMVMHQVPHPAQEKQANSFASELLMPARHIRADLESGVITVPRLLELKKHWKVSMWALLRRAHNLGVLSDWQYRTLAVEMSSLGYRTTEPGELDTETPTAVTSLIAWHLDQGRQIADLARAVCLTSDEFVRLYLSSPIPVRAGTARRPISSTVCEAAP